MGCRGVLYQIEDNSVKGDGVSGCFWQPLHSFLGLAVFVISVIMGYSIVT